MQISSRSMSSGLGVVSMPRHIAWQWYYYDYVLQVSSEYKMRRRIFEPPPPPTAQTEQARNLKFGMVGP